MSGTGGGLLWPALAALDGRGRDWGRAAAAGPRLDAGLVDGTGCGLQRQALAALDGRGRDR